MRAVESGFPEQLGRRLAETFGLDATPCSAADLARAARRGEKRFVLADLLAERSRHEVSARGKRLFTHCALDALMLPFLLDAEIELRSQSPLGGPAVEVVADRSSARAVPESAVLSLGVCRQARGGIQQVCCPLINLFPSLEEYERWAAGQPDADLTALAIDEAFAFARALVDSSASVEKTRR